MSTIDVLDLYDRRSLLSDEERMVQASVARFVDEEVLPIIGDCFAAEPRRSSFLAWPTSGCSGRR
jgi:hypothetical protein